MGKASSKKKIAKASRSANRARSSRSIGWWSLIAGIVVLGVGLVVISRPEKADSVPPRLSDHWHAAYEIKICGESIPPLSDAKTDTSGIHSHGDGLIHIHPFSSRYTGKGANLGAFADTIGLSLTDSSLHVPGRDKLTNGDKCPGKDGKPGTLQVMVWDNAADKTGTILKKDFANYAPQDGSLVTIEFAPKGTKLDKPASTNAIPQDVAGAAPPVTGVVPQTSAPGDSLPSGAGSSTPTEAPPPSTP